MHDLCAQSSDGSNRQGAFVICSSDDVLAAARFNARRKLHAGQRGTTLRRGT
jgi:hypothetical protein